MSSESLRYSVPCHAFLVAAMMLPRSGTSYSSTGIALLRYTYPYVYLSVECMHDVRHESVKSPNFHAGYFSILLLEQLIMERHCFNLKC